MSRGIPRTTRATPRRSPADGAGREDDRVESDHEDLRDLPCQSLAEEDGHRPDTLLSVRLDLVDVLSEEDGRDEDRVGGRREPGPARDLAGGDEEGAHDHERAPDDEYAGLAEADVLQAEGG